MRCWRTRVGSVLSHFIGNVARCAGRWGEARAQPWNPVRGWHPLSTVGILGQIVTFVGAGEGRSGVGTLASPWLHRWGTGGKRQGNRTPGDPRVPSLLPCHPRPYGTNPLPCSFHMKIGRLVGAMKRKLLRSAKYIDTIAVWSPE